MSRIEIPMEEYNGMKEKIESLEKSWADSKKQIEIYNERVNNLQEMLDNVTEASLFDRVFGWKKLLKEITDEE